MARDSSSPRPWEYIDFKLLTPKGGPRESPVAIRLLAGEAQVLLRELLYESGCDEYLCLSSKTPFAIWNCLGLSSDCS